MDTDTTMDMITDTVTATTIINSSSSSSNHK
jgi:hypothetical protein